MKPASEGDVFTVLTYLFLSRNQPEANAWILLIAALLAGFAYNVARSLVDHIFKAKP